MKKHEPQTHAISPRAVSQLGIKQGNHASDGGVTVRHTTRPIYEGRGLEAPKRGTTHHPKGSQGTHK